MVWMYLSLLFAWTQLTQSQEARPTYQSCTVPEDYETQLNIIPIPRGRAVEHGQVITVLCRTSGYTFMNHMYSVEGVSSSDIFFNSYIMIVCRDGTLQPNIFLQTQWCDKGCSKFPDSYQSTYGYTTLARRENPLRNYGKLQAPVSADPLYLVSVVCSPGYNTVAGDTGTLVVRCTETGYNKRAITCAAGCPIPYNIKSQLLNKTGLLGPNKEGSNLAPYAIGTILEVDCDVADPSNAVVSLQCILNNGWEGLSGLELYPGCKDSQVVETADDGDTTTNQTESSTTSTNGLPVMWLLGPLFVVHSIARFIT